MAEKSTIFLWGRDEAVYRKNIVESGRIKGVLPGKYSENDGKGTMIYTVGPLVSLEDRCRTVDLSYRELIWIIRELGYIFKDAEKYLITIDSFASNPENIFLDIGKNKVFLCVRADDNSGRDDLKKTARFLLEAIDYTAERCVRMAYEFYHLCMKADFSCEDILALSQEESYQIFTESDCVRDEHLTERDAADSWINIRPKEETGEINKNEDSKRLNVRAKRWRTRIITIAAIILIAVVLYKSGF